MSPILQSVWIECAEIAPPKWRANLLGCFSISQSCGMWVSLVCMRTVDTAILTNGWRAVIALGGWPTLVMLVLVFWMPETPNSLIQRGRLAEGKEVLTIIRGPFYDCNKKLLDIWKSAGRPRAVMDSKMDLMVDNFRQLRQRNCLPQFLVGIFFALFMESTGTYHLIGHALSPLLGAIYSIYSRLKGAAIIGASAVFGSCVCTAACTKMSPKSITTTGAITVAAGWLVLGLVIKYSPATGLPAVAACILLVVFTIVVAASTGGLLTMFPVVVAENQPLATRAHAVAIAIAVDYLLRAVLTVFRGEHDLQHEGDGLFTAMVGNLCIAAIAALLLPSSKHLPLELVHTAWAEHWLWKRFYKKLASTSSRCLDQSDAPALAFTFSDETVRSSSNTQQYQQLQWNGSGLAFKGGGSSSSFG